MDNTILDFQNISKSYKSIKALSDISFSIPKNSIFGILGANGSGKSTLMKILPGLIMDWSGKIFYKNEIVEKNDNILRKDFGYLIESPTFYEYLSAKKNLEILSRISDVKDNHIEYVLDLVDLNHRRFDKVHEFSYGMKQRLGIAQALLHNPDIIILDEPNNGLDPNGIHDMIKLIKNLKAEGKTICISTHNLKDVEEICTHFTVFRKGKCSQSKSMTAQLKQSNKWLINMENSDSGISLLKKNFKILNHFDNKILIQSDSEITVNQLIEILKGYPVTKISKQSNLIEYFSND